MRDVCYVVRKIRTEREHCASFACPRRSAAPAFRNLPGDGFFSLVPRLLPLNLRLPGHPIFGCSRGFLIFADCSFRQRCSSYRSSRLRTDVLYCGCALLGGGSLLPGVTRHGGIILENDGYVEATEESVMGIEQIAVVAFLQPMGQAPLAGVVADSFVVEYAEFPRLCVATYLGVGRHALTQERPRLPARAYKKTPSKVRQTALECRQEIGSPFAAELEVMFVDSFGR